MGKRPDLAEMNKSRMKCYDGMRFHNYVVLCRDRRDERGRYWFKCKCDCGNVFQVRGAELGKTKSCGCKTKEYIGAGQKTHGESKTKLYDIWRSIKERCYRKKHKSYADYGGRGIKMCEEWKNDFSSFQKWAYANGYFDDAPYMECTIDRIDVNGDYEPSNCRWVSMKVQCNNRRSNHLLTYNGETHTISEWGEIVGLKHCTLSKRLSSGWSVEDALTRRKKAWRGK